MNAARQNRVLKGRDKILMATDAMDETDGITADALMAAGSVILTVLGNPDLEEVLAVLRAHVNEGLENAGD